MLLTKAKNGMISATINNIFLHSKYDPAKEAKRIVDTWKKDKKELKLILILEPGLGYTIPLLKKAYPEAEFKIIFYSKETYQFCLQNSIVNEKEASIYPLINPILSAITEENFKSFALFDSLPSLKIFSENTKIVSQKVLDHLKILQGNFITEQFFEQQWIKNALINFTTEDFSFLIKKIESPCLLLASGESLEKSLSWIQENKNYFFICALPSSLRLLQEKNIIPDLVVSTDPGFYASNHYNFLHKNSLLLSTLTARHGFNHSKKCLVNQNSIIENFFLKDLLIPYLPERGTVALSALYFLKQHTRNSIYILGLDLCSHSIKEHCHPHSFDEYFDSQVNRFNPLLTQKFDRVIPYSKIYHSPYRISKSHDTYRIWIKEQSKSSQIYRLNPSPVKLPFLEIKIENIEIPSKEKKYILQNTSILPDIKERWQFLNNKIHRYQNDKNLSRQEKIILSKGALFAQSYARKKSFSP